MVNADIRMMVSMCGMENLENVANKYIKESMKTAVVKANPVINMINLWLLRFKRKYSNDPPIPTRITK